MWFRGFLAGLFSLAFSALSPELAQAQAPAKAGSAQPASAVDRSDPIAVLQERIARGEIELGFEPGHGFLQDLLRRLGINTSTQILVFSKTSLQSPLIDSSAPRAIYFNDKVTVGSVQNSPVLELMAPARDGYVFYTLENKTAGVPKFTRHQGADCGRCHGADALEPGLIVASTPVKADGTPVFIPSDKPPRLFEFTDQTTPIAERWAGWYVTGSQGGRPHQGNGAFAYEDDGTRHVHNEDAFNAPDLSRYFDVARYLRPTSDIVALMVFEHQAKMTNILLRTGVMAARSKQLSPSARDELIDYMLFAREAPLSAPVTGGADFQLDFVSQGPRDPAGRSLRDFDLRTRLFKYPLSYMIYSPAFEALPPTAKQDIYKRLAEILRDRDDSERFPHLSPDDRRNILEILRATKPDFAAVL